ncbi:unnamed protein product [Spodoptera exigua]|nr:unnamed protein product [Spodoptera exigua]
MDNYELRSLIVSTLDLIKGKPVKVIKAYINVFVDMLKEENYDRSAKEIVDYINSLYGQDSKPKLIKVLRDIDNYGKPTSEKNRNTLVRIIREGIRSIIFDHYTQLNPKTKKELKAKIEAYMKRNKRTSSKIAIPNTRANKTLLYGVYKKEAVKPSERKLEIIEIKQTDLKNNLLDSEVQDKNQRIQQTRKEKKTQSKITEIIMPTIEQEEKELIAHSADEEDEDGSSTSETFESNSIQLSLERQKEFNTMRYVTLYPEAFTPLAPKYQKHFKIVHRSVKATTPDNQKLLTIWVEESTGIIPKYILNKYTTTTPKPQKHKHNKAHKIHEKKLKEEQTKSKGKHRNKYKSTTGGIKQKHGHKSYKHDTTRYTKKHDSKHRTTYKPNLKYEKEKYTNNKKVQSLFEENELLSTNKVMNMFGLVRLDVNQNLLLNNVTAKLPRATYRGPSILRTPSFMRHRQNIQQLKTSLSSDLPSNKLRIGVLRPASLAAIQKRYKMLSNPQNWNERKNSKHHTRSDEGFVEERGQNNGDMLRMKDPALIQRLRQLEKELKEVKNNINTVSKNTKKKVIARRSKDKVDAETTDKQMVKDTGSEDTGNSIHVNKTAEIITTQQQLMSTVKKPEYQIEYKVVKEKGSSFKEIVPDYTTKENEVRGMKPLKYGAIKLQSNDERQVELHNKSILINSTKLSPSTTETIYTTTVKTVEVNTKTAKLFTAKALRVATSTIQPKTTKGDVHTNTKPITVTVAPTTSFTTANANETTTSDAIVYAFKNNVEDLPASATSSPKLLNDTLLAKKVHKSLKQIDALLNGVQKEINKQRIILKSRIDYENAPIPDDGDFLNYDVTDLFWGEQTGLDGMTHEDKTSTFLATPETVAPVQTPEEIYEEEITWPSLTTPEYTTSKYFPRYPYEPPQLYQTIPALTAPQEPVPTRNDSFDIIITPPNFVNMTHKVKKDADYDYHKEFHAVNIGVTKKSFFATFPLHTDATVTAKAYPPYVYSLLDIDNLYTVKKPFTMEPTVSTNIPFTTNVQKSKESHNFINIFSPVTPRIPDQRWTARTSSWAGLTTLLQPKTTLSKAQLWVQNLMKNSGARIHREGSLSPPRYPPPATDNEFSFSTGQTERLVPETELYEIFTTTPEHDPLTSTTIVTALPGSAGEILYGGYSSMVYQLLKVRKTAVAVDVNSIIDYADLLYTDDEGGQLFDAIMEYEEYPNATKAKSKYLRKLHNRNTNKRMREIKKQEVVDDVIKHFSSRLKNIESLKRSSNYAKDMITPVVNNNMFAENKIYFKSSKEKLKYNEYDESPINYNKILFDTSFKNQEESKIDVDGHTNQTSHYIDFDETPTIEENSHVSTNEIDGMKENLQNAIENTQGNENYNKMKALKSYAQILNEDNSHNIPSKNSGLVSTASTKSPNHHYYEMMNELDEGYMMIFLIELCRIISEQDLDHIQAVIIHMETIIDE